jgi:hypothetical protein
MTTTPNDFATISRSPNHFIGHKVAFNPVSWTHVETLLLRLKKRKKYVDATCLTGERFQIGRIIFIIRRRGQRQQSNLYNIAFELKSF